jgi:hypothetical protein
MELTNLPATGEQEVTMANKEQIEQFFKSFAEWRNSLPAGQRWMADALAYSATQGGEVQGYQSSGWSWEKANAFYAEQNAAEWQDYSANANYAGYYYKY